MFFLNAARNLGKSRWKDRTKDRWNNPKLKDLVTAVLEPMNLGGSWRSREDPSNGQKGKDPAKREDPSRILLKNPGEGHWRPERSTKYGSDCSSSNRSNRRRRRRRRRRRQRGEGRKGGGREEEKDLFKMQITLAFWHLAREELK